MIAAVDMFESRIDALRNKLGADDLMANLLAWLNPFLAEPHESSFLAGLAFLAILTCPIFVFLWIGWPWKKNDIFVMLNTETKDKYLMVFQKKTSNTATADARFEEFYNKWYGRKAFILPTFIIAFFAIYLGILIGETALFYLSAEQSAALPRNFTKLPLSAAAAVAGAFAFISWDLTTRAARRNMSWDDVLLGAVRLAVCIPVGYAFAAFLAPALAPFIAFAISALPIDIMATVVKRILNKTYKLEIGADSAQDQLVKLSGIDAPIADRIAEADITTIAQLAYCDPIQLAMRTNLGFAFLLDSISQALAWLYIEEKLAMLRSMGIRGAYEISTVVDDIGKNDANAVALAAQIPATLALTREQSDNLLSQIAGDPYTKFLVGAFSQTV